MATNGPERVTIEIDLAQLWVGGEHGSTFAEHVAGLAADRLLRGERDTTVGEFRRRALHIADEEIRRALKPVVASALDAAVQRTTTLGEPRGETKTLREIIVESAIAQLRKPQDRGGLSSRSETLVQQIIREEVNAALGKELRDVVQEAKGDILTAVKEKAGDVIAETVERLAAGRL